MGKRIAPTNSASSPSGASNNCAGSPIPFCLLSKGLTKLVVTLKNEKASIRQQRIERGMEAKFSKLPNKAMLKGIEP
jgi:hypothetical protein